MALVDPNIALGFRQPEFQVPNALAQYAQLQQIQGGRQAQELNKLQIQEYQRAREEEEGTRNFLRGRDLASPDTLTGLTQFGKTGLSIAKTIQEQKAAALNARNTQSQIDEREFGVQDKKLKFAWNAVGSAATPETAIAELAKGVKDGVFTQELVLPDIQRLQNMSPEEYKQYRVEKIMGILDAKDRLAFMLPKTRERDKGGAIEIIQDNPALPGYGLPVEGIAPIAKTMGPGEEQRLQNEATRIKQEGQRLGLEGRRVAVLEENNRRDADPAFQQRMGGARAIGEAIAKGDVAAMQALPKVIGRAEEGIRLIDELIGKRDSKTGQLLDVETIDPRTGKTVKVKSKPHPGFNDTVGTLWSPVLRNIPGTDAAGFISRFDQIKGASFLEAFESLKGGGAITEKEGQKGTDAINRMSVSTDEKEFIRAAMDLQDVIRKGVANAQTRASRVGGAGASAPAAPAAGGVKFLGFE